MTEPEVIADLRFDRGRMLYVLDESNPYRERDHYYERCTTGAILAEYDRVVAERDAAVRERDKSNMQVDILTEVNRRFDVECTTLRAKLAAAEVSATWSATQADEAFTKLAAAEAVKTAANELLEYMDSSDDHGDDYTAGVYNRRNALRSALTPPPEATTDET